MNVKSILLYAFETWKSTNQITKRLLIFVNKCLDTGHRLLSTGISEAFRAKQHTVYIHYGGNCVEKWRCIGAIRRIVLIQGGS
jgi:hypothetical protein